MKNGTIRRSQKFKQNSRTYQKKKTCGKLMETSMDGNQPQHSTEIVWMRSSQKKCQKRSMKLERGKIDACVYKCKKTAAVLLHHIDDFDICGPESASRDLLPVQFPKNGCKLKMGDMEFPNVGSKTTSDILGRTKINVEDAVITKPNEKHINTILKQLGLENAKSSPVPRKKFGLEARQVAE